MARPRVVQVGAQGGRGPADAGRLREADGRCDGIKGEREKGSRCLLALKKLLQLHFLVQHLESRSGAGPCPTKPYEKRLDDHMRLGLLHVCRDSSIEGHAPLPDWSYPPSKPASFKSTKSEEVHNSDWGTRLQATLSLGHEAAPFYTGQAKGSAARVAYLESRVRGHRQQRLPHPGRHAQQR